MTLRYTDLESFVGELKRTGPGGYRTEIGTEDLRHALARHFNVASSFAIDSLMRALEDFKFIQELNLGLWKIKQTSETQKEEEEKVDKLIEGIGGAKK